MRNWNTVIWDEGNISKRVFTLPMRNWNSNIFMGWDMEMLRFYFTYEELKLVIDPRLKPGASGFYFTYEELKLVIDPRLKPGASGFLLYLWGIETLAADIQSPRGYLVFTLPMRNWNWNQGYASLGQEKVFTLPMRNWNRGDRGRAFLALPPFLLYIWWIVSYYSIFFS